MKRKRDKLKKFQTNKTDDDDDDNESIGDVEFDAYLDTLGAAPDLDKDNQDFDYLGELKPGDIQESKKGKKKKTADGSDEEPELDWDENDSDDGSESDEEVSYYIPKVFI